MWTIQNYFSRTLSILFPPECLGCSKKQISICKTCLEKASRSVETPHEFITSFYSFKDPLLKKAIHSIKYYHRRDLINPLVAHSGKEFMKMDFIAKGSFWVLIPIPMPRLRKYLRGYNQAELIARSLQSVLKLDHDSSALIRTRSPRRQVETRTRGDRLNNQHNSFKVIKDVKGKSLILIDDVSTTGATLLEARNVLLKAGAKEVRAITLAH